MYYILHTVVFPADFIFLNFFSLTDICWYDMSDHVYCTPYLKWSDKLLCVKTPNSRWFPLLVLAYLFLLYSGHFDKVKLTIHQSQEEEEKGRYISILNAHTVSAILSSNWPSYYFTSPHTFRFNRFKDCNKASLFT